VTAGSELSEIAREIAANPQPYMVEPFIEGTELTVGVVQGPSGERALPCSEVRLAEGRSFDYAGKYLAQGTVEVTPAEVPPDVFAAAQALAVAMHRALGCEGYSRTDLIVSSEGPVFLETNTLPGLTRASFIPQQLEAEGTSVKDFLVGQLALARARRDRLRDTRG
jgi:D-alanine-D-alanine ligase